MNLHHQQLSYGSAVLCVSWQERCWCIFHILNNLLSPFMETKTENLKQRFWVNNNSLLYSEPLTIQSLSIFLLSMKFCVSWSWGRYFTGSELSSKDLYHMYIFHKVLKPNLHHLKFLQDWSILSLNQSDQIIFSCKICTLRPFLLTFTSVKVQNSSTSHLLRNKFHGNIIGRTDYRTGNQTPTGEFTFLFKVQLLEEWRCNGSICDVRAHFLPTCPSERKELQS